MKVRVPASSANLGPGFDVLAAGIGLYLELEVRQAKDFSIDPGDRRVRPGRGNLVVRAFERLYPADRLEFTVKSSVPLTRGLGSSAAAIVAGLAAANEIGGLGLDRDALYAHAVAVEGHPDNVGAAVYGGVVVCPAVGTGGPGDDTPPRPPARMDPPPVLVPLLVVPRERVSTRAARAVLPETVTPADAVVNLAAVAQLVLGLERGDTGLIAAGLDDRLHQSYRAELFPRSAALIDRVAGLGALGATVSGAGPTVLVWCEAAAADRVAAGLGPLVEGWADLRRPAFDRDGIRVS